MKTIPKYQYGGINYRNPEFVQYQRSKVSPLNLSGGAQESASSGSGGGKSSSSGSDDFELLDKAVLQKVFDNTLRSDAELIFDEISALKSSVFETPQTLARKMNDIYKKINSAIGYKNELEKAITQATQTGGIYEQAITPTGQMIVQDKNGGITMVSPKQYYDNKDTYSPVTNLDLAQLRRDELPFNSNVITTINGAIGAKHVRSYLDSILTKMKTSEQELGFARMQVKDEKGNIVDRDGIISGLENIIAAYDSDRLIGKAGKYTDSNMQAAFSVITQSMPYNIYSYIQSQIALNGKDPSDTKNIEKYLLNEISNQSEHKESLDKELGNKEKSDTKQKDKDFKTGPNYFASINSGEEKKTSIIPSGNESHVPMVKFPGRKITMETGLQDTGALYPEITNTEEKTQLFQNFSQDAVVFGSNLLRDVVSDPSYLVVANPNKPTSVRLPKSDTGAADTKFIEAIQYYNKFINKAVHDWNKENPDGTTTFDEYMKDQTKDQIQKVLNSGAVKREINLQDTERYAKYIYEIVHSIDADDDDWGWFFMYDAAINDDFVTQDDDPLLFELSARGATKQDWNKYFQIMKSKGNDHIGYGLWGGLSDDIFKGMLLVPYEPTPASEAEFGDVRDKSKTAQDVYNSLNSSYQVEDID